MQWLREHILAAIASAAGALFVLWKSGLVQWLFKGIGAVIRTFRESALSTAKADCARLLAENVHLKDDLLRSERTNLAFGDINTQDRATIRTLVTKIDAHNAAHLELSDKRQCLIDYSDLYDEIRRALL